MASIIKTITLRPVRVIRQSKQNPYMRGLVLKREVTTREACHIYRNIFLFNIDLSLNDMEDKDEKDYFYSDITEKMMEHMDVIDGIRYIQVHPTFFYESLWNVCVLAIMLWWVKRKQFDGQVFLIYLFGYGVGRFWIEGLRTDSLMLFGTGLRVSQALALVMAIGAIAINFIMLKKNKKSC